MQELSAQCAQPQEVTGPSATGPDMGILEPVQLGLSYRLTSCERTAACNLLAKAPSDDIYCSILFSGPYQA